MRGVLRSLLGPDDSLLLGEVAQHQYIKTNTVLGNHSSKITPSTGQASELLRHTLHKLNNSTEIMRKQLYLKSDTPQRPG